MTIPAMLIELENMARKDEALRQRFLETRKEKYPVESFCRLCSNSAKVRRIS